jgi:hypothetical protein
VHYFLRLLQHDLKQQAERSRQDKFNASHPIHPTIPQISYAPTPTQISSISTSAPTTSSTHKPTKHVTYGNTDRPPIPTEQIHPSTQSESLRTSNVIDTPVSPDPPTRSILKVSTLPESSNHHSSHRTRAHPHSHSHSRHRSHADSRSRHKYDDMSDETRDRYVRSRARRKSKEKRKRSHTRSKSSIPQSVVVQVPVPAPTPRPAWLDKLHDEVIRTAKETNAQIKDIDAWKLQIAAEEKALEQTLAMKQQMKNQMKTKQIQQQMSLEQLINENELSTEDRLQSNLRRQSLQTDIDRIELKQFQLKRVEKDIEERKNRMFEHEKMLTKLENDRIQMEQQKLEREKYTNKLGNKKISFISVFHRVKFSNWMRITYKTLIPANCID